MQPRITVEGARYKMSFESDETITGKVNVALAADIMSAPRMRDGRQPWKK
jgi:hypothetical protein